MSVMLGETQAGKSYFSLKLCYISFRIDNRWIYDQTIDICIEVIENCSIFILIEIVYEGRKPRNAKRRLKDLNLSVFELFLMLYIYIISLNYFLNYLINYQKEN